VKKDRPKDPPLINLSGVQITYEAGFKREDLQSRFLNTISERKPHKRFNALEDISFRVNAGEIVGLIGANGAGKTTLCRVVAGLLSPDKGKARVKGQVSALLSLGTGFDLQLTGRENIYLNAMMLGCPKKTVDEIIDEIIDFSGLDWFIDQPIKTYSAGMRGRLGFSIAAMIRPEILILDEALSAGDIEFAEKAGQKLRQIISEARLVLVVSHNLDFIKRFCNRAVWLDQGRVAKDGSPKDVAGAYLLTCGPASQKKRVPDLKLSNIKIGTHKVIRVCDLGVVYKLPVTKTQLPSGKQRQEKKYWALKGLDFSVRHGEIVGIIGPNGAGKTTLCRVLAGILKPDTGKVLVEGSIMSLLSFGTGFDIQLTGRDNVFLNGMMIGSSRSWMNYRYDDIAEFAGIGKFMDKPVKQYSNGMRARLGFAIAAAMDPDIFVIDEALNAGDAAFFEKASARIQEMMTRARATIVVTHNMAFVKTICTRVLWVEKGRIVKSGDPEQVVAGYQQAARQRKQKAEAGPFAPSSV
jgi:teichoic acid transport system ATP-binding protein